MPGVQPVQAHMCQFGKRHRISKLHIKKPTKLLVTHSASAKRLGLKCDGRHVRHQMIGEGKELRHAGVYTKQFAKAVVRALLDIMSEGSEKA
eukprot:382238-Heterocapsa_arctica.AAC.1